LAELQGAAVQDPKILVIGGDGDGVGGEECLLGIPNQPLTLTIQNRRLNESYRVIDFDIKGLGRLCRAQVHPAQLGNRLVHQHQFFGTHRQDRKQEEKTG
jgi:hypothetical protein